ncbi:neuronal pentraxin-2-like [Saccoglossus kowalevskii]
MYGKKMQHNDDSRAVITETIGIPSLNAFSVCMWLKCELSRQWNTVSYAVSIRTNEISLIGMSGSKIRPFIKNINLGDYNHQFTDGEWHHLCMTWRGSDGEWQLIQDAVVIASDNGVETGEYIAGGGSFIIGQEQDSVGGSFEAYQSFVGEISNYNIWNYALSLTAINDVIDCGYVDGNVFSWSMDILSVYEMEHIGNDDSSCGKYLYSKVLTAFHMTPIKPVYK